MFQSNETPIVKRILRNASPVLFVTVLLVLAMLGLRGTPSAAEDARTVPAPVLDEPVGQATSEVTVLAGGCFWGVQGVFQHVAGVTSAVSGYDPRKISYGRLLQIYFSVAHDPTELNRQGPDTGTQYRSAIFPTTAGQARVAKAYIAQLDQAHAFGAAIVTRIEPDRTFYPAESYHQDYLTRHPTNSYIAYNDLPKVDALKRLFPQLYRANPVLVAALASAQ
jgi:peptide-methionine (S)-S-oxide reductase